MSVDKKTLTIVDTNRGASGRPFIPQRWGTENPYEKIKWVKRTAKITNTDGSVVFEQKDIEAPESWTQLAIDIVASKYFTISPKTGKRETSVRQLIDRVVETIATWGEEGNYFSGEQRKYFENTLRYLLVHQYFAFNSPVWFNVGIEEVPQCSACYIVSIEDSMDSILKHVEVEGSIFKFGSGVGTNFSKLRGSNEPLSRGGKKKGRTEQQQYG